MKSKIVILSVFLFITVSVCFYAKESNLFKVNSPDWVQTKGPGGGYINDIAIDPSNPSILYAAGSPDGIYKSVNGGELWNLIKFTERGETEDIMIDPQNPSVLYCDHHGLSKSTDSGLTWELCVNGFGNVASASIFCFEPGNSNILYMAGSKYDDRTVVMYKTENGAQSWYSVTGNLNTPTGSSASSLAVLDGGKLFVGVNDRQLHTWHKGKVFYSDNDGQTWKEIDFGQSEDRFVWSMFVNPFNVQEVWLSEGPLHNDIIEQPLLYKSSDGGNLWSPVNINVKFDPTQVRVIGASSDGNVYVSGGGNLFYTNNGGVSFSSIGPKPREMTFLDFTNIAIHHNNSSILYLPLRAAGIAYSEDSGSEWILRNDGILNTRINLLATDPFDNSVVYASSTGGEGTFRSDDYGESWMWLNNGGIVHPWGDEITIDPIDPNTVWFIPDVPYIHKSTDRGENWQVLASPYSGGNFNFCSVYAMDQSSDSKIMYVLNNGFGIFKSTNRGESWDFLRQSEVDYTYSMAVHPYNSDIVYSGYLPKPFQDFGMVRKTMDGGNTWWTSLNVPNSNGIACVAIDPNDPEVIYAGSRGKRGEIFRSTDGGNFWTRLNENFIMCTVWGQPQLIIDPLDPSVAYAATWLAGTWKTTDAGANWTLLEDAPESSTALSLNVHNRNIVYLADRTAPKVWKTMDGGSMWEEIADFSRDRAFLLNRVLADGDTIYTSTFGPGLHGGKLYKSTNGGAAWIDITGTLPRSVLDVVVDPSNRDIVYVTTHIYGAYKSTNGGTDWAELENFPNIGAYDIEVDPVDSKILYACGLGGCSVPDWCMEPSGYTFTNNAGVYKSVDSGSTWKQILTTNNECRAIRIHPDNHNILFAAAMDDGLLVSTDRGDTWTGYNQGLDTQVLTSCALDSDKIYIGTQSCGVYSGDINTENWSVMWQSERSNKPVPEVYSLEIKVDPNNSDRIFVGSNPGGLYRSDNSGLTFYDKNFLTPSVVVDDPFRQGYYTFAINSGNTEEVWLGTWGKGVFKSYDGMDFDIVANGSDRKMYGKYITQIVIDPNPPNTVYAATTAGVYKTDDGGTSWSAMNQGLVTTDVMRLLISSSGELYAGTRGYGLFRWKGMYWEPLGAFGNFGVLWPLWNDRPMYQYTFVLIYPDDNSKMLLGTFPQGIYKSIDGGQTWRESNVGWTDNRWCFLSCVPS